MSRTQHDLSHVRFISAGAGSGKTYRLTEELEKALSEGRVVPAAVIGTTFTVKAATELQDRVRIKLAKSGWFQLSERVAQALIGTVHSVCLRLLGRSAFEIGLSPDITIASVQDAARLFSQALDEVLSPDRVRQMNTFADRLGLVDTRSGPFWHSHVQKIVGEARSNDIEPDKLLHMGRESADRFLAYFPRTTCGDEAGQLLLDAIQEAIASIDPTVDNTAKTREYLDQIRGAAAEILRDDCRWTLWISLSKSTPAKKSQGPALAVQSAASSYDSHAGFQADIRRYIENVFAIAAQTLTRFQELKTQRGLVDYEDMEQLALRALDEPAVAQRLGEEIELLLVDEFQDTNPMQLALFMKLSRIAQEAVFVGDVKQAIFGFRGSDPRLVRDTLEALANRGSTTEVVNTSWRSRPSVLRYLNAVFGEAFERDNMERSLVEMSPKRSENNEVPAVVRWILPKNTLAEQADSLARAVSDLRTSGLRVNDPENDERRSATFGDIAILAATNHHVQIIAKALHARRVPVKMTLAGLLATPEVCLARACLRLLNDDTDTIATAEIRALGSGEEPEVWLADRLGWLQTEGKKGNWSEKDDPIVSRIAHLRSHIVTQTPVEIVARALNYVGLRPIVTAWGPDGITAAQRQRNLDAFLDLTVQYENHCASQHEAATLTGFLFWLENPSSPELDLQPVVAGGDAVHVLTYHRAKGLEWPIVVTTDFHYDWQHRIWDVRVETNRAVFDLNNPLDGRVIRFYPNVFGRNSKGVPVLDNVMESDESTQALAAANAEWRRLAYVGMTRARDTIIIAVPPTEPRPGAWIQSFRSPCLLPQGDEHPLPAGEPVRAASVDLAAADFAAPEPVPFRPTWFFERSPLEFRVRERLRPSRVGPIDDATIGEIVELGPRVPIQGNDMENIGRAVHATIAAEFANPGRDDAVECAASLIRNTAGEGTMDPAGAVECTRRLRNFLDARFSPLRMLVEYPVECVGDNGQVLRGWIDLILETEKGWIVIDHKSSPRPRSEWPSEALEHSGQLAAYGKALRQAGLQFAGCWVHFAVSGALVEVMLPFPGE